MKLALLTEIPAPFRLPLFRELARRVELEVLFLAERDPRRSYAPHRSERDFAWRVLPGREVRLGRRWVVLNRGVRAALEGAEAVVVGGWNQPAFWQALRSDLPTIVWVESTGRDARRVSSALGLMRRGFVRKADACVVPGRASAAYVRSLGVPEDRIATAHNAVDLEIFRDRVAALRRERDRIRAEESLSGTVFLAVGRLAAEKGVDVLLRALASVEGTLLVAGSGPERATLERLSDDRVRFLGQVPRDELPRWYAAADAYVLPSLSEPWGMTLNEAAAAGLPIVASDAAGAAHDLVEDGRNGFRVPAGDVDALAEALRRLAADAAFRDAAGRRSLELAARFTPEAWADAVVEAALRIARGPTPASNRRPPAPG